jgi:hypothetical protein
MATYVADKLGYKVMIGRGELQQMIGKDTFANVMQWAEKTKDILPTDPNYNIQIVQMATTLHYCMIYTTELPLDDPEVLGMLYALRAMGVGPISDDDLGRVLDYLESQTGSTYAAAPPLPKWILPAEVIDPSDWFYGGEISPERRIDGRWVVTTGTPCTHPDAVMEV